MKKILLTLIILIIALTFSEHAVAQAVYGPAIKFEYNTVGQRVKRYYVASTILNKFGDTLSVASIPDTIKRQENTLLKSEVIVKAYPNPTTDMLTIENLSWQAEDKVEVRLFDITGKFISSSSISQAKGTLPFNGLAAGTYHVHYYLNGNLLTTWKIIRQ